MASSHRKYDPKDKKSILEYAKGLVGRSLRQACESDLEKDNVQVGKGRFGNLLEKYYFKYEPNNDMGPDFPVAGLELKSTPLQPNSTPLKPKAKERLVLNMIDYMSIIDERFETSHFWKKNKDLLIVVYQHQDDADIWDLVIKHAEEWVFPKEDEKVIRGDWASIRAKVVAGNAHLLSEGDTNYLGACTKGSKATDKRDQPKSKEKAKPRAFSIKQNYVNTTILRDFVLRSVYLKKGQRIGEPPHSIIGKDFLLRKETFEAYIQEKFLPFIGRTIEELHRRFDIKCDRKAKNYYSAVSREIVKSILGIQGNKILEFEKADITLKTIRLLRSGRPKEAMSFPAIHFKDLVHEEWESSEFYDQLQKRYFFVIFQYDEKNRLVLKNTMFWCVPLKDFETIKEVWERTKQQALLGEYEDMPKASDRKKAHVRPHGRDADDLADTPGGERTVKKSFWLNQDYLQEEIAKYS